MENRRQSIKKEGNKWEKVVKEGKRKDRKYKEKQKQKQRK